ncbi:aldo/keto reductase [Planomonospora venezuelensis]|uniref:Diketogulonate reductase-like aldo/keto reductase n=1 Tax=Planomonospora venezuelensis TaxID=1999 RepID=A0A841D0K9_PLAVE|nr:aldo/keto reductase [Planomonospora venezuelensis]MBB5964192.1 diketogulonate reductase-like aldo/keto reductase [Planomonospora venezuelensis]GIN04399.1 oxidoreductase [Planomonospora venezuelensis]
MDFVTLNNGVRMPRIGLGVWRVPDDEAAAAAATAIEAGYRSVDTAKLYRNERGVGRAVRASGVPREELFVTTKLWNDEHGYDAALRAFDASMDRLGLDYLDLYLIHWPVPARDRYVETWRALERLCAEGRVRAVGVSNFTVETLDRLLGEAGIVPAVNQIELHPMLPQAELRGYHAEHGIVTEAWSPLGQGRGLLEEPVLAELAAKHGRSPAQVVLRWHLQLGGVVIPKSVTPSRIAENIDVFDFVLDPGDMAAIAVLDSGTRLGPDPATFNRAD